MKKKRCTFCGRILSENGGHRTEEGQFCSEECRTNYQEAVKRDSRYVKFFMAGILIALVLVLAGACVGDMLLTGEACAFMGVVILVLPFATPETVTMIGYRKSRIVGRIGGLLLIATGIWTALFN